METASRIKSRLRGFTLVELLIVLLLVGLTLGLVFNGVERGSRKMRERDLVHAFVSELRRARIVAGRTGRIARFQIKGGTAPKFGSEGGTMTEIPKNVDVFASTQSMDPDTEALTVTFFPDGSVDEREFQIKFGENRDYRIHLDPVFGLVSWEKSGSEQ